MATADEVNVCGKGKVLHSLSTTKSQNFRASRAESHAMVLTGHAQEGQAERFISCLYARRYLNLKTMNDTIDVFGGGVSNNAVRPFTIHEGVD